MTKNKKKKSATATKPSSIQPLVDRLEATVPKGRVAFLEATGARLAVQLAAHYKLSTAGNARRCIERIIEHLEQRERAAAAAADAAHEAATHLVEGAHGAAPGAPGGDAAPVAAAAAAGAPSGELGASSAPPAPPAPPTAGRAPAARDERLPPVGTVIEKRDRKGTVRCSCTVEESGLRYAGTLYRSLSGAAMAAAKDLQLGGKTQNGFAFWGITKPARPAADVVEALARAWTRYSERVIQLVDGSKGDERAKLHGALTEQLTALSAIARKCTA